MGPAEAEPYLRGIEDQDVDDPAVRAEPYREISAADLDLLDAGRDRLDAPAVRCRLRQSLRTGRAGEAYRQQESQAGPADACSPHPVK
jgi:hypothetical protein